MWGWGKTATIAVSFGLLANNLAQADTITPEFFDNCHHLMQSVGNAKSGKVLITTKNLGTLKDKIEVPGERFPRRLDLSLEGNVEGEFRLLFAWKTQDLKADSYRMLVRPDRKVLSRYWIEIQFPTDEAGEWKNVNLLYDAFEHLHLRMKEDVDEFILDLRGRHLIDQLNSILNDTMKKHNALRDPIRRVSSEQDIADWLEGVEHDFDFDRDSFLPIFESSDLHELLYRLDEGSQLRLEWLTRIRETSLMKVLEAAGHWSRNIELQIFRTQTQRREALPVDRVGEDGLIVRYQLRLRPGF